MFKKFNKSLILGLVLVFLLTSSVSAAGSRDVYKSGWGWGYDTTSILLLLLFGVLIYLIIKNTNKSEVKYMLLGISIILIGGIITVSGNTILNGFEYLIIFTGFIITVFGFGKK